MTDEEDNVSQEEAPYNWRHDLLLAILGIRDEDEEEIPISSRSTSSLEAQQARVKKILKDNGKKVDWRLGDDEMDGESQFTGLTPLIAASMTSNLDIVKMLVKEFKANVTYEGYERYEGWTPLVAALTSGQEEIVKFFASNFEFDFEKVDKRIIASPILFSFAYFALFCLFYLPYFLFFRLLVGLIFERVLFFNS